MNFTYFLLAMWFGAELKDALDRMIGCRHRPRPFKEEQCTELSGVGWVDE